MGMTEWATNGRRTFNAQSSAFCLSEDACTFSSDVELNYILLKDRFVSLLDSNCIARQKSALQSLA